MADWRALGYVPDSDEEDSIYSYDQSSTSFVSDGFQNIEDLERAGKNEPGNVGGLERAGEDKTGHETDGCLLGGLAASKTKAKTNCHGHNCKENIVGTTKLKHKTINSKGWFVAVEIGIQKPSTPSSQIFADDEIDELQQDHYDQELRQSEADCLPTVEDPILQSAIAFTTGNSASIRSLSSSPLTEPPPSPDLRLPSSRAEKPISETHNKPGPLDPRKSPVRSHEGLRSDSETNATISQRNKPNRTLRRRNPIQLHPYAIEDEKYRQVLKARGIMPLRITEPQEKTGFEMARDPPEAHRVPDEDSQFSLTQTADRYQEDSHGLPDLSSPHDDDLVASSPLLPRQTLRGSSPLSNIDSLQIEDDFPDIPELLQGHRSHKITRGFKRQKLLHTFSRKGFRKPRRDEQDQEVISVMPSYSADNPINAPLSPAPSTPLKSHRPTRQAFRFPRGVSPSGLPTPAISSDQRPDFIPNLIETPKSSIEHSSRSSSDDLHSSTDHSDSPTEDTRNRQLERAQRKIRGVLPASWLKLDLTMQESKDNSHRRPRKSLSPITLEEHRGVARPVPRGRIRKPAISSGFEFPIASSDDESSGSVSEGFGGNRFSKHQFQERYKSEKMKTQPLPINKDIDEVLEDNRIDEMIPSVRRSKPFSNRMKGIQTKLVKQVRERPQHLKPRTIKSSRKKSSYQPRITDRFHQSYRKQPLRLSILDIVEPDKQADNSPFLRIASRTARLRRDQGKQSPTSKYIRLATNNDTNDANQTLQNWRHGTIEPISMRRILEKEVLDRQPFRPRSGNEQPPTVRASTLSSSEENQNLASEDRPAIFHPRPSSNRRNRKSMGNIARHQPVKQVLAQGKVNNRLSRLAGRNNRVAKRGHILSSMQNLRDPRPAALERLEGVRDRIDQQRAFDRSINNTADREEHSPNSNVLLRRFLDLNLPRPSDIAWEPPRNDELQSKKVAQTQGKSTAKTRSRKSLPKRMDLNDSVFQPVSLSEDVITTPAEAISPTNQQGKVIIGLGPFGARYTSTFDIGLLPSGVILHASTFVGSGNFHRSLGLSKLKIMEEPRGFSVLKVGQHNLKCGPWADSVSTQIGNIFDKILVGLEPSAAGSDNIVYQRLLSSQMDIIAYFSDHLSFSDGVDRISCLSRCKTFIVRLLDEIDNRSWTFHEKHNGFCLQVRTLILAFSNQLLQMCNHDLVPSALKEEIWSLVVVTARRNLHLALKEGFSSLPRCLENLQHLEDCEHGIRNDFSSIEAVIVTHHILRENADSLAPFWDVARDGLITRSLGAAVDFGTLESSWQKLFTTLPFLDFDAQGIVRPAQRFHCSNDDWPSVKLLIDPILSLYQIDRVSHVATINSYFRALLGRCLHLINKWGWERCQLVIGIFFDFFARNNLAFLINEESHGSPSFLENLDQTQTLEPELKDRSFQLFLKIVGSGINRMRKFYPEKKMRDIVWRLMPNHGRQHPKDEAVIQRDLDALRNHHDLLCVLYWASPASARPRVSLIRNLVHLESSHREACHINIRSWANLVRFQLSTDESVSHLAPFAEWHNSLLEQLLSQHKHARTEAEDYFQSVKFSTHDITSEHIETTIMKNQRQVAAILGDALTSLEIAIDASKSLECANALLTPAVFSVFDLFDARRSQSHQTIMQALDVMQAFLKRCNPNNPARSTVPDNDDSQDYGDWTAFTETLLDNDDLPVVPNQSPQVQASQSLESFLQPLKQLLSNCFGADKIPQDSLLLKVTRVWVGVAQVLVRQGIKSWDDFITQYGTDAWDRLRRTEQSRKFNAYYLALLIETGGSIYEENRVFFLSAWLESLVERESLVKFQTRLTTALINVKAKCPLLKKLPFWTESRISQFEITISEFLERRLALISTVFANMRDSLEEAARQRSEDSSTLRQTYKDMVKRVMAAMKDNYLELGQGLNVKDAYVRFVHRVVELLQQYTSEICPVDRFFVDALAFPLPTTDPTYVVGRIKSYGLRLGDSRTPKQLSVYLQSVFERTAADGQQDYLVGQLIAAMADTIEHGDSEKPSLRSFIIKAIVPAYLEVSLDKSIGWYIASPLLEALQTVFRGLLGALDGTSPTSIASVVSIINAFVCSARASMELLLQQTDFSERIQQTYTLRLLGIIYSDINALLPVVDYIIRLAEPTLRAVPCIEFFTSFATTASNALLTEPPHDEPLYLYTLPELAFDFGSTDATEDESSYNDVRAFTSRELRDSLSKNWVCHDGHYFLTRGQTQREIAIKTIPFEDAKREFLDQIEFFFDSLATLPSFGSLNEEVVRFQQRNATAIATTSFSAPDDDFPIWI